MDTHFIMAHLENAAAHPRASVSALHPLEATPHTAAAESSYHLSPIPFAPMTNPSVTSQLSQSQVLIIKIL